ncbi:MAG TPA: hypothetical protein VFB28_03845 [Terriglobales bacterium]|nr:hypothetical protein [Terriglobales bacterium]
MTPDDQRNETIALAANLVDAMKASKDFYELKTALVKFITAMDEDTYVLGDCDLCGLAQESLARRGKSPSMFSILAAVNQRSPTPDA